MKKFLEHRDHFVIIACIPGCHPLEQFVSVVGAHVPVDERQRIIYKGRSRRIDAAFQFDLLIVANKEHREYGHVVPGTAQAAFLPMFTYAIAALVYPLVIYLFRYTSDPSVINLLFLIAVG